MFSSVCFENTEIFTGIYDYGRCGRKPDEYRLSYNPSGSNGKNGCEEVGDLMQTINDISALLINIIRAGLGFRVIYCCIRLMSADEEQGTYKRRIRNSLIAVAVNELVWVIKDLVISYF